MEHLRNWARELSKKTRQKIDIVESVFPDHEQIYSIDVLINDRGAFYASGVRAVRMVGLAEERETDSEVINRVRAKLIFGMLDYAVKDKITKIFDGRLDPVFMTINDFTV